MSTSDEQPATTEPERRLSPEESLALVDAQRTEAVRSLRVNPVPILAAWGVAWLAGFGAVYLADPDGPVRLVPTWLAWLVVGIGFTAAVAVSVGQGAWHGRGIDGPSRRAGALYGWSWLLGFGGLLAINTGLQDQGLPSDLLPLVWSGGALLVVGLLYLAGGIVWGDGVQYGLGAWTLVTGAASVSAGVPDNFVVLSLAGGGGFLGAAAVAQARRRRRERARR